MYVLYDIYHTRHEARTIATWPTRATRVVMTVIEGVC